MTFLTAGIRAGRACYAFFKKWNWEVDGRRKISQSHSVSETFMEEQPQLHTKKFKENVNWVKRIRCSTVYHNVQSTMGLRLRIPVLSIFRRKKSVCIWYRSSLSRPHLKRQISVQFVIYA